MRSIFLSDDRLMVQIEEFKLSDFEDVVELSDNIIFEVGREMYDGICASDIKNHINGLSIVALVDGKLAGFHLVDQAKGREYVGGGAAVVPEHRGRNVHGRLIDALIDRLKVSSSGFTLRVTVNPKNTSSLNNYLERGFEIEGVKGTGITKRVVLIYES